MPFHQTLKEQKEEIFLLIDYAAPKEHQKAAKKLVEHFQADRIALNILQAFYSYLPEAEDDYVIRMQLLDANQKTFLILLTTALDKYIYMAKLEGAEFLGKHSDGIWDEEVLKHFQLDQSESVKRFKNTEAFSDYTSLDQNPEQCLACAARIGENHRLGCPVEICPWCSGMLVNCNCRFEKMGVDKLSSTQQIDDFMEILNQKGRIPFDKTQRPGGLLE